MKKIWVIVIGIVAVVLAGGYIFFSIYNKPHRDIEQEPASFTVTASQIYDEFEQDEAAATAKYLDKVVEIFGRIEEINTTQKNHTEVILAADGAMVGGVQAVLHPKYEEEENYIQLKEKLQAGKPVVLKCRCTGMTMDVVMVDCFITNNP